VVCAAVRVVVAVAPEAEPAATAPTAASVATLANAAMAMRNFMIGLPCEGRVSAPGACWLFIPFPLAKTWRATGLLPEKCPRDRAESRHFQRPRSPDDA